MASKVSSFFLLRLVLEFFELLQPRGGRRIAHAVGIYECTLFWHPVLGADVRLCVSAANRLLLCVRRMQRGVKCSSVSHVSILSEFSLERTVLQCGEKCIQLSQ